MQVRMDKQQENHGKWHANLKDSGTTRSKSEYLFGIYIGPQSMGRLFGPTSMPISHKVLGTLTCWYSVELDFGQSLVL